MGAAASATSLNESSKTARLRASGKIRDSFFLTQQRHRRKRPRRRASKLNVIEEEKETTESRSKHRVRRISLVIQKEIDRAKGILKDDAFISRRPKRKTNSHSRLVEVNESEEKGEKRLSWGERVVRHVSFFFFFLL